jgi:hypothetical protein
MPLLLLDCLCHANREVLPSPNLNNLSLSISLYRQPLFGQPLFSLIVINLFISSSLEAQRSTAPKTRVITLENIHTLESTIFAIMKILSMWSTRMSYAIIHVAVEIFWHMLKPMSPAKSLCCARKIIGLT